MRLTQIRNATMLLSFQDVHLLVDPMLSPKGTSMPFRYMTKHRRRNPTVDLPEGASARIDQATHALITHFQKGHTDHLDSPGMKLLREKNLTTFCSPRDYPVLKKKGISALEECAGERAFFDGTITPVPARHGRGWMALFMEHGVGYVLRVPGEPSIYLIGDSVLTDDVRKAIETHQPDYIVVPAGAAQMDLGAPILMPIEEVLELVALAPGKVIANHMEALDHCPTTRAALARAAKEKGLDAKLLIPEDGEELVLQ